MPKLSFCALILEKSLHYSVDHFYCIVDVSCVQISLAKIFGNIIVWQSEKLWNFVRLVQLFFPLVVNVFLSKVEIFAYVLLEHFEFAIKGKRCISFQPFDFWRKTAKSLRNCSYFSPDGVRGRNISTEL